MNSNKENNKKIEKKIRMSEPVKQVCKDHISEWEGNRVNIVYKFIKYLADLEIKVGHSLEEDILKINNTQQAVDDVIKLLEELEALGQITIHKDKFYTFIIDNEKKTECISISLTKQEYKEIEQAARKYKKEFSQFVRQPFYYYEKYKKFPWE